ncbi:hypothetical protein [Herbiconiux sp. A18JL235]|uniref:Uncharacterized protein n=1 Tax=Herbiconiux sp. A18JL235 TaxID=3152363 RepID=A0AB39BKP1_9MICO
MSGATHTTVGVFDADPRSLAVKSAALEAVPGLELRIAAESLGQMLTSPAFPTDVMIVEQRPGERVSINYKIRVCRLADARVIVVRSAGAPSELAPDVTSLMTPVATFEEAIELIAG